MAEVQKQLSPVRTTQEFIEFIMIQIAGGASLFLRTLFARSTADGPAKSSLATRRVSSSITSK